MNMRDRRAIKPSIFARLRRDRSGSAAVEFAMIAAPFFLLLFAMIEVAAVFFTGTVLENAVLETARQIRTGCRGVSQFWNNRPE
jgi:Flp pilus assembly protein TadG